MRIGLQIPTMNLGYGELGERIGRLAEQADEAGFDSIWVMDHFFLPQNVKNLPGSETSKRGPGTEMPQAKALNEILEGWSTLNYLAGRTKRAMLGTLVTGVTYRYPGVLVKMANTLDALSNGRSYFGIGAAWEEDEHHRLGIPYPSTSERFERLEEALQLALQMWQGEDKPYEGKYYQLSSTESVPLNVQKPHPPIMVGGGGEKKTLRLVAKYADACNIGARYGLDELKRKLEVLQEHCEELKRPYGQIEKTSSDMTRMSVEGKDGAFTPTQLIERYGQLAEMGIEHVMIMLPDIFEPRTLEILATQVLPEVKKLRVAGR